MVLIKKEHIFDLYSPWSLRRCSPNIQRSLCVCRCSVGSHLRLSSGSPCTCSRGVYYSEKIPSTFRKKSQKITKVIHQVANVFRPACSFLCQFDHLLTNGCNWIRYINIQDAMKINFLQIWKLDEDLPLNFFEQYTFLHPCLFFNFRSQGYCILRLFKWHLMFGPTYYTNLNKGPGLVWKFCGCLRISTLSFLSAWNVDDWWFFSSNSGNEEW